jgi:hypothetical protein
MQPQDTLPGAVTPPNGHTRKLQYRNIRRRERVKINSVEMPALLL